ncbi:hypothetical protein M0R45_018674 [Rubus argutus]|uniref:Secreted protein n=1 Tax=Rubus argutus TaxID=59490 RepID=A0AAW1X4Z9_RUBAR
MDGLGPLVVIVIVRRTNVGDVSRGSALVDDGGGLLTLSSHCEFVCDGGVTLLPLPRETCALCKWRQVGFSWHPWSCTDVGGG